MDNVHPNLRFQVTNVTFHELEMGMVEQDSHLTKDQKDKIYAEWMPRVGQLFDHTGQFPEGVQWCQVWSSGYQNAEWWARHHCIECRRQV